MTEERYESSIAWVEEQDRPNKAYLYNFESEYAWQIATLYGYVVVDGDVLRPKNENWTKIFHITNLLDEMGISYDVKNVKAGFFRKEGVMVTLPNEDDRYALIKYLTAYENKKIEAMAEMADYDTKIKMVAGAFKVTEQGYLETPKVYGKNPELLLQTDVNFKAAMAALRSLNCGVSEMRQGKNSFVLIPDGKETQNIINDIKFAGLVLNSQQKQKSLSR